MALTSPESVMETSQLLKVREAAGTMLLYRNLEMGCCIAAK